MLFTANPTPEIKTQISYEFNQSFSFQLSVYNSIPPLEYDFIKEAISEWPKKRNNSLK